MTTFTVTQINNFIKNIFLSEELLLNISVIGEISDYKVIRGIAYFSIKDNGGLLSCILFNAEKAEKVHVGDKVVVTGSISYYVKGGKLTFNARKIEKYGIGDIYKKFIELKDKLSSEGLFDKEHKKKLPEVIRKIGIITSSTGAVIQDIINVAHRRDKSVDLLLYPSKVQGIGSLEDIIKGIEILNLREDVDVIIVARGGGSLEDLQPFNTEEIAKSVFSSNKPIISAVGHETDYTIIDMVSDLRAPTPSAAAELLTNDIESQKKEIVRAFDRLNNSTLNKINYHKADLNSISSTLCIYAKNTINNEFAKLESMSNNLDNVNPVNILKKGYSKSYVKDEELRSVDQLKMDEELTTYLSDGNFKSIIKSINKKR